MSKYQNARSKRGEARTITGRFRGGKLAPVKAVPYLGSESGILNQTVTFELDPIAGRMITQMTAHVFCVYVPAQAMDEIKDPLAAYAGSSEVLRTKMLSGAALFGLEEEGEISKRCGVNPESIGGVKKVNECVRLAHNCAVNYLRKRKYVNATQLLHDHAAMTPALIGKTVLERLNGVLDPEDRVNGQVNLDLSTLKIPTSGVMNTDAGNSSGDGATGLETGGGTATYSDGVRASSTGALVFEVDASGVPQIFADMDGLSTGVSLQDFYTAERMDALTREMRLIVDKNPEFGEEMVANWAHGLSIDGGKTPFLLHESSQVFGSNLRHASDGANLDVSQSDMAAQISFTVPVPPTEFGGVVITFAVLKPDETLASQPHPILSKEWGAINFVADELALDPVPVTIRDLDSDCLQADEGTIALYIGNNNLKRSYLNYGFSRELDKTTVANKTAIWQLEVPMSVTPESVIYPEYLEHYPFQFKAAEVCTYTISTIAQVKTPIIFGPTPVEELASIETEDIFEDVAP